MATSKPAFAGVARCASPTFPVAIWWGEEDGVEEETGFRIRRARFKLDGHAYKPWLGYYLEYGIAASVMLTFELEVQKSEQIGARFGQFKVPYNRERLDSSGKQQFADRSIVNNPFTVDRQSGMNLQGHLFAGSRADSKYNFGVYTGTGRGGDLEDDRSADVCRALAVELPQARP